MKSITVLVCTRKKNKKLIKCLKSIKNLKTSLNINLVLIENNTKKTLKKKDFIDLKFNKKIKINYFLEKKIGIPYARNKGLEIIKTLKTNFVCFFDDDCEVSKNWLKHMIDVQDKVNVDILTGPQISKNKNIYFKVLERRNNHLSKVSWGATNNIFIKKKVLVVSKLKFSEKLKYIGGSDQLFFLKLNNKGHKIIWNDKSTVYELPDNKRENFNWFLKRNIRYGTSSVIIYKELYGLVNGYFLCFCKSIYEFTKFIFYLFLIFFDFKLNFFRSVQFFVRSLSTLAGIFGLRYYEYK